MHKSVQPVRKFSSKPDVTSFYSRMILLGTPSLGCVSNPSELPIWTALWTLYVFYESLAHDGQKGCLVWQLTRL